MKTELLRHSELFSRLSAEDLAYIAERSGVREVPDGTCLFRAGDPATRFFIVRTGTVRIFRLRESGEEEVMALFAPGDALGDFDFARGAIFDASAAAAGPASIIAFPAEGLSLDDLSLERPDVVARIKLRFLAMIAGRLRSTNRLISENSPWVRELRRQVHEDPGTGLWTRAFLDEEVFSVLPAPAALVVLKPRRFKDLVDARGHAAGDEAMVRLAAVLKDVVRQVGAGWAIRVRSNETALVVPGLDAGQARDLASTVLQRVSGIEAIAATGDFPVFRFEAAVAWALWPEDGADLAGLFGKVHEVCLTAWKAEPAPPMHVGPQDCCVPAEDGR